MKRLRVEGSEYKRLMEEFSEWLGMLRYSESTIEQHSNQVNEFFYYLETIEQIKQINQLNKEHLTGFYDYLHNRTNHLYGGGLSLSHISGIIQTANKLLDYLRKTDRIILTVSLKNIKVKNKSKKEVLTISEVKELIESIDLTHPVGKRTRAIIGLLYGAGLRKSELENLKIGDIHFQEGMVEVKKGKGNKARLIPLPFQILKSVKEYLTDCRDIFQDISGTTQEHLFIEITGRRMSESALYKSVREAIEESGIKSIQKKNISLHSFRHSIATHLMEKGMEIEDIARFLGHSSLDSTMIYTHIRNGSL